MTGPLTGIDVLILAGGKGTRIKDSLPEGCPKIMAEINGKPMLLRQLTRLKAAGADRIIVSLPNDADMPHYIMGFGVDYTYEPRPLGTVAAVRYARHLLYSNPVVIMNGDTWATVGWNELLAQPMWLDCVAVRKEIGIGTVCAGTWRFTQSGIANLCAKYETGIEQYPDRKSIAVADFIDIGTPEGLERARREIR